jgi:peptidyl-prolyl cis-trans isomerase C
MNLKSNQKSKFLKISVFLMSAALPVAIGCNSGEDKAKTDKAEEKDKTSAPSGLTAEQAAMVVAKVGDQTITVGDITDQINKLSPYIRRRWAAPEKRKEFLDNLIRVELLSQEAKRLGLGNNNPEVDRVVDQVMIRLMIQKDLEKDLVPSSIDEEILKQEYDKEKDKYQRPAQIRASHILLKTKAEADKLLADLKGHATDSRYFRDAVTKHSIDESSKTAGGDLGYFSETGERSAEEAKLDPAVAKAAWQLDKVGDFSEPIQAADGFHILKLTNKRAKLDRSFDSVKRMIESRLLREKRKEAMDKFVNDLKSKAKVEIFEDNLAKLKIPQDQAPPGMPGAAPQMGPPPMSRPISDGVPGRERVPSHELPKKPDVKNSPKGAPPAEE